MTPGEEQMLAEVAQSFCKDKGLKFVGFAGHGAFKATFKVVAKGGHPIALKACLPGSVNERTNREIEALVALSKAGHESLPRFLAVETYPHKGKQFVLSAEEFLDGGNLTEFTNKHGLLDHGKIAKIARQLASAISVVAGAQLVHRDIKPDNIVLRSNGTAVLVDFGLVRNLSQLSLTQTWLPQGPGTPFFATPEQLNNDKHMIDWRSDQFSLGVTLAICGRGQHPFAHPGDPMDAVVGRVGARPAHYPHHSPGR